jgi:hypothetical protein
MARRALGRRESLSRERRESVIAPENAKNPTRKNATKSSISSSVGQRLSGWHPDYVLSVIAGPACARLVFGRVHRNRAYRRWMNTGLPGLLRPSDAPISTCRFASALRRGSPDSIGSARRYRSVCWPCRRRGCPWISGVPPRLRVHSGRMVDEERCEVWHDDARVLAEVGRQLSTQPTRVQVRLSRALAAAGRSAWERDADERPLPAETAEQRRVRHRAGTMGLIGLCIENRSSDEVDVELDAWEIGLALEAADEAGLLGR